MEAFYGILIPFLGTSLGAACVFFMRKTLSERVQRALLPALRLRFSAKMLLSCSIFIIKVYFLSR